MAEDTHRRVQQLINELYDGNYIDEITKKNGFVRHQATSADSTKITVVYQTQRTLLIS